MSRLCVENNHATPRMTTRPSSPVKRPILDAYDFKNHATLVGLLSANAESVFHHLGRFFHVVFARVIEPAENRAYVHLLAGLDFEYHSHRRVDRLVLAVASRANHIRGDADVLGQDRADIPRARRRDLTHAGSVGKK